MHIFGVAREIWAARVRRGGAWDDFGLNCRAASRLNYAPDYRGNYFGFRLCFRLD